MNDQIGEGGEFQELNVKIKMARRKFLIWMVIIFNMLILTANVVGMILNLNLGIEIGLEQLEDVIWIKILFSILLAGLVDYLKTKIEEPGKKLCLLGIVNNALMLAAMTVLMIVCVTKDIPLKDPLTLAISCGQIASRLTKLTLKMNTKKMLMVSIWIGIRAIAIKVAIVIGLIKSLTFNVATYGDVHLIVFLLLGIMKDGYRMFEAWKALKEDREDRSGQEDEGQKPEHIV